MSLFKIRIVIHILFGTAKCNSLIDLAVHIIHGDNLVLLKQQTFFDDNVCHFLCLRVEDHAIQVSQFVAIGRVNICSFCKSHTTSFRALDLPAPSVGCARTTLRAYSRITFFASLYRFCRTSFSSVTVLCAISRRRCSRSFVSWFMVSRRTCASSIVARMLSCASRMDCMTRSAVSCPSVTRNSRVFLPDCGAYSNATVPPISPPIKKAAKPDLRRGLPYSISLIFCSPI